MAWEGVREKAKLPQLQLRDLRHLGATEYARRGLNAHELKAVLGHTTLYMAQVYVNLAHVDVLNALDSATGRSPIVQVPTPDQRPADETIRLRRSERLALAVRTKATARAADAVVSAASNDSAPPKASAAPVANAPPGSPQSLVDAPSTEGVGATVHEFPRRQVA
jgi:hypothetical protein